MNNLDENICSVMELAAERHSHTPTQSFEEYRNNKYRELENLISSRRIIYLDMNFWIWLRNPDEANVSISNKIKLSAALFAALRLDDNYKFEENDLDDIQHSSVAVAYCDIFLTEKPMADKLRRPAVQKVICSKCKIIDDFDETISILN